MEKFLIKHVRPGLCTACDLNPEAWRDLGMVLMPDAVAELCTISRDHRDNIVSCCSSLFWLWLERQPDATWKQLIKALKEINLNHLAAQIEEMLTPSINTDETSVSVEPVMPVECT